MLGKILASRRRTIFVGPVRVELDLGKVGRPQFARGPGWVALSWGNGWDAPAWVVEVEVPW